MTAHHYIMEQEKQPNARHKERGGIPWKKSRLNAIRGLLLKVAVFCFACFMVTMLVGQQISISQKKDELQQLKNELKEQQVVNDELRYDLNEENADNTDYAEKVARRELDYVKPGERVFYNVGGNN